MLDATAAPLMDQRRRQPRRRDAALRRRIHTKAGRLDRFLPCQADLRERSRIKRGLVPKCSKDVGRASVHGTSFHPQRRPVQPHARPA